MTQKSNNGTHRSEDEHKIYIACVTEIHLILNENFYMNRYKIYRNDLLTDRASGGVLLLVASKDLNRQLTVEIPKI